jgi:hypothetical protein
VANGRKCVVSIVGAMCGVIAHLANTACKSLKNDAPTAARPHRDVRAFILPSLLP